MSNILKRALVIGLIGLVAACTRPASDEFVVVETKSPASVSAGKF